MVSIVAIRLSEIKNITITLEILKLITEIDEFKGRWKVMEALAPEKLTSLRISICTRLNPDNRCRGS
jgi:hypothetical protein